MSNQQDQHWLVRPATIRKLWIGLILILSLTVVAEFAIHKHAYFRLDKLFGFHAWYGFLTCVAMVFGAKLLGLVLKRPDDYYQDEELEDIKAYDAAKARNEAVIPFEQAIQEIESNG